MTKYAVMRILPFVRHPAESFKALSDPTRFRALRLLVLAGSELCACEIIDALEKPQYAISKALGALVDAELVDERREGRMMMYSLAHGAMNDAIFRAVAAAPADDELVADEGRLKARLAARSDDVCVQC